MTRVALPVSKEGLLIDYSGVLRNWQECPRKLFYAWFMLRRAATEATALRFGRLMHQCLAIRYKCKALGRGTEESIRRATDTLIESTFRSVEEPDLDWRDSKLARIVMDAYESTYCYDDYEPIIMANGRPAVELTFAVKLGDLAGIPVRYIGAIDLVAQDQDGLWLVDTKTTSVMGEGFWKDIQVSPQLMGYTFALRAAGYNVVGYQVNAIALRKPNKSGEANVDFARQRHFVDEDQLNEWVRDVEGQLTGILDCWQRQHWPRHCAHCVHKFGTCEYYDVCTLTSELDQGHMLDSNAFVHNDWTPLRRLNEVDKPLQANRTPEHSDSTDGSTGWGQDDSGTTVPPSVHN